MVSDKVYYNGDIVSLEAVDPDCLTGTNYIYQRIHTSAYSALHLNSHLELLQKTSIAISSENVDISESKISKGITTLLKANRFPSGSNLVTIRVYGHNIFMDVTSQLLYPQYTLWHNRITLGTQPTLNPFSGYQCAVSLMIADHARKQAVRQGFDNAVLVNSEGIFTNIDDEPMFMVFNRDIVTSPLSDGANDTVMRRLIIKVCQNAGMNLIEHPLTSHIKEKCDEIFYPTTQGIISIKQFDGMSYINVTAGRIAELLNSTVL